MALIISTNLASLNAQRNLAVNQGALDRSVQRLSSGLRINQAADDAAGLSISERLRAFTGSMHQAIRNAQDGVSLIQTTEGSLTQIGSILTRMRELATQAASGTLDATARAALDTEYRQLISEIDRIANVTEFNGVRLLDGSTTAAGGIGTTGVRLQVGFRATANDSITVLSGVVTATASAIGIHGSLTAIATSEAALSALPAVDSAIVTIAGRRGELGAFQNRLGTTISNLRIASENFTAADSRIRDADFAAETAIFTRNQILVQAATAILAQANIIPQNALTLLR
jgi:flagellin